MNFINQSLKNVKKEKCTLLLKVIFGVLLQMTCNQFVNITKELSIYCALLICFLNIPELSL